MNVDVYSFALGLSVGIVLVFFVGVTAMLLNKIPRAERTPKENKPTCNRCRSKKLNPVKDKPGFVWCAKCGNEFKMYEPTPVPKPPELGVLICKYCEKPFETEDKLKRHVGMAHYKELNI